MDGANVEIDVRFAFANGSILGWSASVFLAAAPGLEEIGEKVSGKKTFLPRARALVPSNAQI
jgi:hypothetical protein